MIARMPSPRNSSPVPSLRFLDFFLERPFGRAGLLRCPGPPVGEGDFICMLWRPRVSTA